MFLACILSHVCQQRCSVRIVFLRSSLCLFISPACVLSLFSVFFFDPFSPRFPIFFSRAVCLLASVRRGDLSRSFSLDRYSTLVGRLSCFSLFLSFHTPASLFLPSPWELYCVHILGTPCCLVSSSSFPRVKFHPTGCLVFSPRRMCMP